MTRSHTGTGLFIAAALAAASCGVESTASSPAMGVTSQAVTAPSVRISELHYDNVGTDVGEAVEISGPAGMDVTGWSIVLYNGNGGASYTTTPITGAFSATCGDRGVMVFTYPTNGIQNGGTTATGTDSPDGLALVDGGGAVVEFLSYEGVFAATNGPALGVASTDIAVRELGNEPAGQSLQRSAANTWSGPIANTFGACNDAGATPPPPTVASVTVAPTSATAAVGGTQAFTATALDAASQPITGVAFTWSSTNTAVATVSASGVATAVAAGDAVITAAAPNSVTGTAAFLVTAAQPGFPDTRFSELHYDNVGVDTGEAIEVEGPAGTDLTGWTVVLYDGNGGAPYSTTPLAGPIPATCGARGVVVLNYPSNGIQNGSPDGMALIDAAGHVIEFLSYEGAMTATSGPAAGMTSIDIIAQEASSSPIGQSLQRDAFNHWTLATSSFGACNAAGTPPPVGSISFSGRAVSDTALPVGFQAQLFATERDASNATINTTFVWTSDTPDIATVDQNGVFTGLAAGTAILRATAADDTTGTTALPVAVGVVSATAVYLGNAEFGEPTDADPSDDFIVRRAEYTLSYNNSRGEPNWVAYDLNATDIGTEDRCNCFTFDPALPASFTHLTTADYTGAGAFAGFGIDRGHMTRSFDRTTGTLDNAHTFLLSNVVPQAADLNQGPWAILEDDLGDLATLQNKEVRIITGPAGSQGTVKGEGKIVIPTSTWKVAVIMPRGKGLADIHDYRDVQVIAVNMPNIPGIRNVPWQTYQTTVDAIEALTGYDLLALLPDKTENIVEAGIQPPLAFSDGPYVGAEGSSVTMTAAASVDPNGTIASYAWSFDDGTTASGATVSHTFAQDGVHQVTLVVTDNDGLTDTLTTTATIANVAPTVGAFAGAQLLPNEAYAASGTFTDPGADTWTATVDYGDGSGATPLALSGTAFSLSHTYRTAGAFTVTVSVSDGEATSTSSSVVTVETQAQAVRDAIALVDQLVAAGKLRANLANLLRVQLQIAANSFDNRQPVIAVIVLQAVVIEIDLFVQLRQVSATNAAPLRALVVRIIRSATAR